MIEKPFPLSTIEFPFPWKFVREHYSDAYLLRQISEDVVQESILDLFRAYSVDAIAIDAGGKMQRRISKQFRSTIPTGHSDLAGTLAPDGVSLYVEVKAPLWIDERGRVLRQPGSPTVAQLGFLASKHERGAIVLVAYSIDDVANFLRDRLQRNLDGVRNGRSS